MQASYTLRTLKSEELPEAMALAWQVFLEFEAPSYGPGGTEEFARYVAAPAALARHAAGQEVAWGVFGPDPEEALVGMAALRPPGHVSLLFVRGAHHRRGLARRLMDAAAACARQNGAKTLEVNSSIYGQAAYVRLGFVPTAGRQQKNGISFVPMRRPL